MQVQAGKKLRDEELSLRREMLEHFGLISIGLSMLKEGSHRCMYGLKWPGTNYRHEVRAQGMEKL